MGKVLANDLVPVGTTVVTPVLKTYSLGSTKNLVKQLALGVGSHCPLILAEKA